MQFYEWTHQRLVRLCIDFIVFPLSLPGTKEINYDDLKALVGKSQNLLLVDVRNDEEVGKGRIQGSVHIPGEFLVKHTVCAHWTIAHSEVIFFLFQQCQLLLYTFKSKYAAMDKHQCTVLWFFRF